MTARPWTPDRKNPSGSTTVTTKRACNGCGLLLGDVTMEEIDAAIAGLPLSDVRGECPICSLLVDAGPGWGNHQPRVIDVDCTHTEAHPTFPDGQGCPGPGRVVTCVEDDEDWPCVPVRAYRAGLAEQAAGGKKLTQWAVRYVLFEGGERYEVVLDREIAEASATATTRYVATLNEPTRRYNNVDKAEAVCRNVTTWDDGREMYGPWHTPTGGTDG